MFQRMIDDIKDSTSNALRMTYLAIAAAVALFITTSFLCAAAFVAVLQNYGLIEACLAGAGVFFVLSLMAAGGYLAHKRRAKVRAAEAPPKSAIHTALADPMLVAAGIQVIRAIGVKKLVPLLAIGGVALGLLAASRKDATDQTPAE